MNFIISEAKRLTKLTDENEKELKDLRFNYAKAIESERKL
jgi:hypothetical protein